MINQRLFDWYGIDIKKNLNLKSFCPKPFDTLLIDKNGSCFVCECTAWLPQSIGNLHLLSLNEILNSPMLSHIQNTITDGSYRYCNNKQCSYLLDSRPVDWPTTPVSAKIKHIRLAIDDSCNLSCPSCRTRKIFVKNGKTLAHRINLAKRVIDYVANQEHEINLHVGSDGDPFASLVYRYFFKQIKNLLNVKFSIQTNGLLIKKMYQRHEQIFQKLNVLNVSIDGATKNTYEQLRRGGSYEKIIENLEYIKKIKSQYNFKFIIHFVVQSRNYKEMPAIVELAEKYGADKIWLNKITNWNTYTNFAEQNITDTGHVEHTEYVKILEQIKKKIKINSKKFIEIPTLDNQ